MAETKNLCAQIPILLHERVSEERERLGQTTSEYITQLIQDYYNMTENQKGGSMTEKSSTMAFQIPEELLRIKRHLERESLCTGRKLTQRDFVLGFINQALDVAEAEGTDVERDAPMIAPAGPSEEPSSEEVGTGSPTRKTRPCEAVKGEKEKPPRSAWRAAATSRRRRCASPGRRICRHC